MQPPISETALELSSEEDHPILLRLAETPEEIIAAQKLRYAVFYEEFGATPSDEARQQKRDFDIYDDYADHLIVIDLSRTEEEGQIIGTYRLFRAEKLPENMPFYSSQEFDISSLLQSGLKLLELGRSCVLPPYRTKYVMQRLWQGIAEYVTQHKIDLLFGCASLPETDPAKIIDQLAYFKHFHAPPPHLCPQAIPDCTTGLELKEKEQIDPKQVFSSLPPLIKGYIRVGSYIGQGAFLDKDFNCIDICIVLPTEKVTSKYMKHYMRVK